MFDKAVYNKLLEMYISSMIHWDNRPVSSSAKREATLAKFRLDTYITDHVDEPKTDPKINQYVSGTDDMESVHYCCRN